MNKQVVLIMLLLSLVACTSADEPRHIPPAPGWKSLGPMDQQITIEFLNFARLILVPPDIVYRETVAVDTQSFKMQRYKKVEMMLGDRVVTLTDQGMSNSMIVADGEKLDVEIFKQVIQVDQTGVKVIDKAYSAWE